MKAIPAMNIAMALTWTRIAMIPVLVIVFYLPWIWAPPASAVVFFLAAITDWFDGYIARRLDQGSRFGAFLDPVADKLMVVVALVLLVQQDGRPLLAIPAAIIVGREIAISALREWMAEMGEEANVRVSWIGKVKTFVQMGAIVALLFRYPLGFLPSYEIGLAGLYAAALLTLWSMFGYLRTAWPSLTGSDGSRHS